MDHLKPLFIHGATLVESTKERKVDLLMKQEKIVSIANAHSDVPHDAERIDATDLLLLPLLIDCHVHFREPGLEHKATMKTEAAAALSGGVGTVCEMPNTIPPTVTIAALADKVRRASNLTESRMLFFFGVTEPIHLVTLRDLWTSSSYECKRLKNHCSGVKLYLDHSTGDQKVNSDMIADIFRTCAELQIPVVAHCENPLMNEALRAQLDPTITDVSLHSSLRPPESEGAAIAQAIDAVRIYGTALHIAHLSTKQGIDLVRKAKAEKLPVTCEVAPHHLFLTTEDYKTLGTFAKMNPPLRSAEHQEALWQGIMDHTVDCIATDHAPHTKEEKLAGNPLAAPSGVPGVETMLPLLLTVAAGHWPHPSPVIQTKTIKLTYADILRLCFEKPNAIFSLHQEKIEEGASTRLMLIDPKKEWIIEGKNLKSLCGWTPYEGWKVCGSVVQIVQ